MVVAVCVFGLVCDCLPLGLGRSIAMGKKVGDLLLEGNARKTLLPTFPSMFDFGARIPLSLV